MNDSKIKLSWYKIKNHYEDMRLSGFDFDDRDFLRISLHWDIIAEKLGLDRAEFIDFVEKDSLWDQPDDIYSFEIPELITAQLRGRKLHEFPISVVFGQRSTKITSPLLYNMDEVIETKNLPWDVYYVAFCDYEIPLASPPYFIPEDFSPSRVTLIRASAIDISPYSNPD